jgi:GNAT superfamily N-acetyltransferase
MVASTADTLTLERSKLRMIDTLRPMPQTTPMIRPIEPRDLANVRAELEKHWHSHEIWSLGKRHQADTLPGFVAEVNGEFAGLVTLNMDAGGWQCEVITLSSRTLSPGTGAALLAAAEMHALTNGCGRIYLTTTNDNSRAIRFYQRQDWRFAALHKGVIDRARALFPHIPLRGLDDIQVRDEIEFEKLIGAAAWK